MLETGFRRARSENLAKLIQTNLFTNIKLNQGQNRAAQGSGCTTSF
jgi:hypothetical protein